MRGKSMGVNQNWLKYFTKKYLKQFQHVKEILIFTIDITILYLIYFLSIISDI